MYPNDRLRQEIHKFLLKWTLTVTMATWSGEQSYMRKWFCHRLFFIQSDRIFQRAKISDRLHLHLLSTPPGSRGVGGAIPPEYSRGELSPSRTNPKLTTSHRQVLARLGDGIIQAKTNGCGSTELANKKIMNSNSSLSPLLIDLYHF